MSEIQITPEMQEVLPKAVKEVTGLYLGDTLSNVLKTQSSQQRDGFWQEAAQEFSPFCDTIKNFRNTLKNVEVTKNGYPESVVNVLSLHFSVVEDKLVQQLLTDVLFSRISNTPGYLDYKMDVVEEAEKMIEELGFKGGLRAEEAKSLTFDKTVESILTGSLRLTRQTQLLDNKE